MRLLPDDRELGWMPYAWLLYLWFIAIAPVIDRDPRTIAITVASVVVFLPMYFRNFWVRGAEAVIISSAIGLLGVLVLPFNWGANSYFVYSAASFGYATRPARAAAAIAILVVAITFETIWFDLLFWAWFPGAIGCLAVGGGNIHFAQLYRERSRVLRAQEQAEEMAKVAERERIARDLHDLLGHTLSVIVMKSELASKLADRDFTRAIQEIRDVERVSREALTEVRHAVEGYRQHGLAGEMRNAASALQSAGVTFEADCAPLALAPRQETALALALREAITNVVRHAQATICHVSLRAEGGRLVFTVRDNGRGGAPREGNGLSGMRTRIVEAGGTLSVDGSNGMQVVITIPLPSSQAALAS